MPDTSFKDASFRYVSERDIDYGDLGRLLRDQRWKDANEVTLLKLLQASGRLDFLAASGQLLGEDAIPILLLLDAPNRLRLLEAMAKTNRLPRSYFETALKSLDQSLRSGLRDVFDLLDYASASGPLGQLNHHDRNYSIQVLQALDPILQEHQSSLLKAMIFIWRERGWHLTRRDIENFPCADLQTIDRLWFKFSQGRFGFTIQKFLWEEESQGNLEKFGERVGWRTNNTWIDYDAAIFSVTDYDAILFSTEEAPAGHLPIMPMVGWWCWMGGMKTIIDRLDLCSLPLLPLPSSSRTLSSDETIITLPVSSTQALADSSSR